MEKTAISPLLFGIYFYGVLIIWSFFMGHYNYGNTKYIYNFCNVLLSLHNITLTITVKDATSFEAKDGA